MLLLKIVRALQIIILAFIAFIAGVFLNIMLGFSGSLRRRVTAFGTMVWARIMCRILGIRVVRMGDISGENGTFSVCNHISYVDIIVIAAIRPAVFVARHDMKSWPLLGWLASLAGTVYLNRKSGEALLGVMTALEEIIAHGINVVIFPEGTTSDGKTVKKFKSSLFDLPARRNLAIQPISIRYTGIDETMAGQISRDSIAWYGDMTLLPHLWTILGLNSIQVSVCIGRPLLQEKLDTIAETRKRLCLLARQCVIEGFESDVVH
jgi:lyso-ornithine lipid O-acyltransferase